MASNGERYVLRYEAAWGPVLVPVINGRFTCGYCHNAYPVAQLATIAFLGMRESPHSGRQVAVSQPRCRECIYRHDPPSQAASHGE